ncbi:MAG: hypothetical protein M1821_004456 [Bathelium mastoideum]|nr:MAG: hypothetical protein M1821_004456 [Bathelium mastoideum]
MYKPTLLNANDYDKEAEEQGTALFPGAKVFRAIPPWNGYTHQVQYTHYVPTWDPTHHFEPSQPFPFHEHGQDANPSFPDLLGQPDVTQKNLTPLMGTEISGVQLSQLSNAGKDQLALLCAQRKVLVFLDQDFADLPIPQALEYCRYFGRLNVHPTTGSPEGYPEVHLAHVGAGDRTMERIFSARTTSMTWHSDTSFERQPAGTTFMYILEQPDCGGDTVFADCVAAYNRPSPSFQQLLHGHKAVHSGRLLARSSRDRGGIVRREPGEAEHPLVRTHPATGEKALYVNPHYTESIVGFKKEESEALLGFLFKHITTSIDLQLRVRWTSKAVVVWDNRLTLHAATFDWDNVSIPQPYQIVKAISDEIRINEGI